MDRKVVRVAYLSYDGLTDPLGQSQVIPYLIGLAAKGYHFTVFSFEKSTRYNRLRSEIKSALNKHDISWRPLRYTKWPRVLSTICDIIKLWRELTKAHMEMPYGIIHCRSYVTSLIGLKWKREFDVKFIFDMRGFWADERVEGGLWDLRNPVYRLIYKFFKSKERDFLVYSDATISLTQTAKKILSSRFNLPEAKIYVIPCSVDCELFNEDLITEEIKNKKREELGISKGDFVLLYLGSVGTWYLLDEMLIFFKALLLIHPTSTLLIVTQDSIQQIEIAIKRNDAERKKIILTAAERNQVPLLISLAGGSIFLISPSYSKQASFPTKLGEILSMGVPVATNSNVGDNNYLFHNHNLGPLISAFSPDRYKEAARQLLNFKEKQDLKDFARNNLSLKMAIEVYHKIYKEI